MTATVPTSATTGSAIGEPVDIDHYIDGRVDARAASTRTVVYNPTDRKSVV